jgi:hypothetical protein
MPLFYGKSGFSTSYAWLDTEEKLVYEGKSNRGQTKETVGFVLYRRPTPTRLRRTTTWYGASNFFEREISIFSLLQ